MNTVDTPSARTSEVDTSWRGMLADPEAVFFVGMFGGIAACGAFRWQDMPWLSTWTDGTTSGTEASLHDVTGYLAGQHGTLTRVFFGGGGLAVAVAIVLGILLTWIPLPTARVARAGAIVAAFAGLLWTFAALAFAPTRPPGGWLGASVHEPGLWLAVFGYAVLAAAAAMTRPAVRREL